MNRLSKPSILTQENILVLLVPAILYFSLVHLFGMFWCILFLSAYGCFVSIYSTRKSIVAFFFALFGLIEWMVSLHLPQSLLEAFPQFSYMTGALQIAVIMLVFSFLRFPLPMLLAEATYEHLKALHRQFPDEYIRMWQKISAMWILCFLGKALVFYLSLHASHEQIQLMSILLGWPLYCMLILVSIIALNVKVLSFYRESLTSENNRSHANGHFF
ncbi:conserved hypothetical protein [Vibrio nigripulchritudo SO65]|uniref:hypothetical protein n=1 Tax=Vibrio nigripulchritudo TaxID=28173 RepID=UPI0003B1A311|nr:hypothetical protein [Vibrio nigripulchritudo]CCN37663.1 conserved hypothetical protein [Vibrio nigripulchritudo AM115]CCN41156.1 conserved hypothetical protein [Vibrio nigripulchritudo FTn2]CCN67573.1 conserved hypothetical protein [Vibrio nigripulchritudo POn4]CCN76278.1 conserved hypothetical protein [Vibrio nigripulchritudo SO65]